jgi:hypothetical protein
MASHCVWDTCDVLTNSAAVVRFLRDITAYRRTDQIRNQTIGREVNVFYFIDKIVEYEMNWFYNLERREEINLIKILPVCTRR